MRKDHSNEKYNMLTVKFFDENRSKNKRSYWWCQCDCGSELKSIEIYSLTHGHSKSCGCNTNIYISDSNKKYNTYDLTGDYGIGYTLKGEIFLFDLKYYDKIKNNCWHMDKDGYILSRINGKNVKMHRLIMNCPKDLYVDHIKGKGSENDNREENLRICTHQENMRNRKNTKGVCFNKNNKKWRAYIGIDGKQISLGSFETEEEALNKRIEEEKKVFSEFAPERKQKA